MRIEFHQGVPEGCTEWLNEHVGKGGYVMFPASSMSAAQAHEAFDPRDLGPKYVPTITIKDEKKAMWFALRWSS